MPQFRQDFITKEWVIVAPERAKRPDEFAKKAHEKALCPARDPSCPFCPGNEGLTPPPVLVRNHGESWWIRVVPNKFAAVDARLSPKREAVGGFLAAQGFGIAEVVVESPAHNTSLGLLPAEAVKGVLDVYKERYTALSKNDAIDMVTIFRNHGAGAGTSLVHPHSQIIATPIVPPHIRHPMQQALLYHDAYGRCPYCVMIEEELSNGARIVIEGKSFVVLCPFASRSPFETRIFPKRHFSRFDSISEDELAELAQALRLLLKKLHAGLGDPDYNLVVHTSPTSDGEIHYDHLRFAIVPRLTTPAGFEMGSGIFINIMAPEDAAAFLREVDVD